MKNKKESKKQYFFEGSTVSQKKKKNQVPEKWRGEVHPVGYFPGHLKRAKRFYNHLDNIHTESQMTPNLSRQMANPDKLSAQEELKAKENGLTVKLGYVVKDI